MSEENIKERFLKDIRNHKMEILSENGVFRSLLFKRDGSHTYYFQINTWNGSLCISGDMGTYVFSRLYDMFDFFEGDYANLFYWGEKLQNGSSGGRQEVIELDEDEMRKGIIEYFNEYWEQFCTEEELKELLDYSGEDGIDYINMLEQKEKRESSLLELNDTLDEINNFDSMYNKLDGFESEGFEIDYDFLCEFKPEQFSFHYSWCCHAIQYASNEFKKLKLKEKNQWIKSVHCSDWS